MSKKADGIPIVLKAPPASTPIRVYGTELAREDEVVIRDGTREWKGKIQNVNRAKTVGRVNVTGTWLVKVEQSEGEEDDVTTDDDLVAITITITSTPGSAGGTAVIEP